MTGVAAPILFDNINTDQISPTPDHAVLKPDYKALLFARWRYRSDGSVDPEFILNRPAYRNTRILISRRNFGCGSSREGAVTALSANGIRCVVARSFADTFRENCVKNGVLPAIVSEPDAITLESAAGLANGAQFTVNLGHQTIICPDGTTLAFSIVSADRAMLLEGFNEIDFTLQHVSEIEYWEKETAQLRPWLQRVPKR